MVEYVQTGMVPRMPSLIVAAFLVMIACLLLLGGLVIDGTRKSRHELSRLAYMRHPAVRGYLRRGPGVRPGLRRPRAHPDARIAR